MSALYKTYDILRDFIVERFYYPEFAAPRQDLSGRIILVTGGNAGLGRESVRQLALMGPAKIILTSRSVERGRKAREELIQLTNFKDIQVEQLDLCSFDSVNRLSRKLLASEKKLDVLMCNAGLGSLARTAHKTEDGFDEMFQGNNLGHYLLTQNLLPLLQKADSPSSPARIIMLSSLAAKFAFSFDMGVYANPAKVAPLEYYNVSKLMAVLMANGLADRLGPSPVSHSCHPGTVATEFADKYPPAMRDYVFPVLYRLLGRSLAAGAATQVYLASAPEAARSTGRYWTNMRVGQPNPIAEDAALCKQFVDLCDSLIAKHRI